MSMATELMLLWIVAILFPVVMLILMKMAIHRHHMQLEAQRGTVENLFLATHRELVECRDREAILAARLSAMEKELRERV